MRGPLAGALSRGGLLLAGAGAVFGVASRQRGRWLLTAFPAAFLLFIASLPIRLDRWALPTLPFLCLLAAHALDRTAAWIGGHGHTRVGLAAGLLTLGVAAPLLKADLVRGHELSGTDTRTLARAWMLAHVPAGSRVLFERDTPQFSGEQYQFMLVLDGQPTAVEGARHGMANALFVPDGRIGQLRDPEAVRRARVAYMVLSVSSWYERYVAERERYPEVVATYETVMRMGTQIYEVQRTPGVNDGPSIRVYRVNGTE